MIEFLALLAVGTVAIFYCGVRHERDRDCTPKFQPHRPRVVRLLDSNERR